MCQEWKCIFRGGIILKKHKKIILGSLLILAVLMLSGCAAAETEGHWFHDYLVYPFIVVLKTLGEFFGNSYGLAIITITIILRALLLPFALNMAKKQVIMREKMQVMKPELDEIQKRLKQAKNKEEQMKIQQEMLQLYQKHDFNPLNMGCLPILLQIPIWMGLYYAIRLSDEISNQTFLWFNLGQTDIIMAIIAGIAYYFQFKVTMAMMPQATAMPGLSEEQVMQQQSMQKMMGILSPVMIFIASMATASALSLYWAVSGIFLIGQTYITRKMYPIPVPQAVETAGSQSSNHKHHHGTKKKKRK